MDYATTNKLLDSIDNKPRQLQNLAAITEFVALIFPLQVFAFDMPHLPASLAVSRFQNLPMPIHWKYGSMGQQSICQRSSRKAELKMK